jgi:tetratricopeptide (TPR) repeat protein
MFGHHFISYSSLDGLDLALRLHEALTSGEPPLPVWLDRHELRAGSPRWDAQLDDALRTCASLIFLMTPDSVEHQSECANEWSRAMRYKKPITLVLGDSAAAPPFAFERRQYIDCSHSFQAGVATLRKHLEWLKTPPGILQELQFRRETALRDMRRAQRDPLIDPMRVTRIEAELNELDQQIYEQEEIVADPAAAARRVENSIALGLERERQQAGSAMAPRTKFINPPPGLAPEYFQDRYVETKLIAEFLQNDSQRLLTLVGRGGVGKTALSCRLLKSLESGVLPDDLGTLSIDGIVYLSGVGSHKIQTANLFGDLSRLLPHDAAAKMEALYKNAHVGIRAKLEALLEVLPPGRVVVLLDNFEDVVDPQTRKLCDPDLFEALQALLQLPHHAVKLVLTTRVAALDLAQVQPGRQARIDLDEGLPTPFAENILRAMDADGKVGLRDAPAALLREAQTRTRGYPRALEALFAILSADRDTSLGEVLAQTEALPEGVVEALVGDAFSRLDAVAQQVMQAMAIYGRPVTANAIDYLLQPYLPSIDSARVLGRLVNMLLVRKDSGRYHLHPVDGAYALSRLPEGEPADHVVQPLPYSRYALLHRGAEYFRQARKPADQWKTLDDLLPQLAEFDLRCASQDFETAARVLIEIDFQYLRRWGHYALCAQLHERLRDQLTDPALETTCVGNLGIAYRDLGEAERAIACFERALALARQRRALSAQAVWLCNIGATCDALGQTQRSLQCHQEALVIDQKLGDEDGVAVDLHNLSGRFAELGQTEQALAACRRSIEIARRIYAHSAKGQQPRKADNQRYAVALRLGTLARLLDDAGDFPQAIAAAKEGLHLAEDFHSPEINTRNRYYLGLAQLLLGEFDAARDTLEAAAGYDFPRYNHRLLVLSGLVRWRMRRQDEAAALFDEAAAVARKLTDHCPNYYEAQESLALAQCGRSACGHGDHWSEAERLFRRLRQINAFPGKVKRTLHLLDQLESPETAAVLAKVRPIAHGQAE